MIKKEIRVPFSPGNSAASAARIKSVQVPVEALAEFRKCLLSNPGIYGKKTVEKWKNHENKPVPSRLMAAKWHFENENTEIGTKLEEVAGDRKSLQESNSGILKLVEELEKEESSIKSLAGKMGGIKENAEGILDGIAELRENSAKMRRLIILQRFNPFGLLKEVRNLMLARFSIYGIKIGFLKDIVNALDNVKSSAMLLTGKGLGTLGKPGELVAQIKDDGPLIAAGRLEDAIRILRNASETIKKANAAEAQNMLKAIREGITEEKERIKERKRFLTVVRNSSKRSIMVINQAEIRGMVRDRLEPFFCTDSYDSYLEYLKKNLNDTQRLIGDTFAQLSALFAFLDKFSNYLERRQENLAKLESTEFRSFKESMDALQAEEARLKETRLNNISFIAAIDEEMQPKCCKKEKPAKQEPEQTEIVDAAPALTDRKKAAFLERAFAFGIVADFIQKHSDQKENLERAFLMLAELYVKNGGKLDMQSLKKSYPKRVSLQTSSKMSEGGVRMARFCISSSNFYRLIVYTGKIMEEGSKTSATDRPLLLFIGSKKECEDFIWIGNKIYLGEISRASNDNARLSLFPMLME